MMFTTVEIIIGALVLILAISGVEEWRISHLNAKNTELQSVHEVDLNSVNQAQESLQRVMQENKTSTDLLAAQVNEAEKKAKDIEARYQQIMEVKDAQDGFVAPVLRDSIERLRGRTTSSHH